MPTHILVNDSKILQTIIKKVDELNYFYSLLSKQLDPLIARHCQVTKFEKNCLFILVDNGSWATQLRFQIPDLMAKLRAYPELEKLGGIICKIRPPLNSKSSPAKKRTLTSLTRETAEAMLETAKSVQDSRIRKILEKIALYK